MHTTRAIKLQAIKNNLKSKERSIFLTSPRGAIVICCIYDKVMSQIATNDLLSGERINAGANGRIHILT